MRLLDVVRRVLMRSTAAGPPGRSPIPPPPRDSSRCGRAPTARARGPGSWDREAYQSWDVTLMSGREWPGQELTCTKLMPKRTGRPSCTASGPPPAPKGARTANSEPSSAKCCDVPAMPPSYRVGTRVRIVRRRRSRWQEGHRELPSDISARSSGMARSRGSGTGSSCKIRRLKR